MFGFKFLFLLCFAMVICTAEPEQKSFIVKNKSLSQQHQSKNNLKEDIGDELEILHTACTSLSKQIAKIQFALAESEEILVQQGKALINNQTPFKKADKEGLAAFKQELQTLKKKVINTTTTLNASDTEKLSKEIIQTQVVMKK